MIIIKNNIKLMFWRLGAMLERFFKAKSFGLHISKPNYRPGNIIFDHDYVSWLCITAMYHGYVSWLCIMTMYHGYVSWLYMHHCYVSWLCIMGMYHGYVSWLCILAMYLGYVSWLCIMATANNDIKEMKYPPRFWHCYRRACCNTRFLHCCREAAR